MYSEDAVATHAVLHRALAVLHPAVHVHRNVHLVAHKPEVQQSKVEQERGAAAFRPPAQPKPMVLQWLTPKPELWHC